MATIRRLIPRFILQRDQYAVRKGLSANTVCRNDDGDLEIRSIWQGTEETFRALKLLRPSQRMPTQAMGIMTGWACGTLYRLSDGRGQLVMRAEVPYSIEQIEGNIERCDFGEDSRYQSRVAFHGTEQALRAAGLAKFSKAPWRRPRRCNSKAPGRHGDEWQATHEPDGQILYWALQPRQLESSAEVSPEPARRSKAVTLAPFPEGNLTEFDKYLVRVCHTLSAENREHLRFFADACLSDDGETRRANLRLVVDNAGSPEPGRGQ